ncbi:MAG: single-stranded DNA-binding protein [Bacilli bacterium]|nr:single-stranded DNA-binding protein [Bacilli bacterium]
MLNQVVLVGRLTQDITLKKSDNGKSYAHFSLAVPRSFKNMDGTYETDFIDCVAWEMTAKNTATYCKKGNIVGIKGRVQSTVYEKDKEKKYKMEIIAEKVTFLTKNEEPEEEAAKK